MMGTPSLVIRNVEIERRRGLDVRIVQGRVTEIGRRLGRGTDEHDGGGGALLPGLTDHHCHVLSAAAQARSIRLDGVTGTASLRRRFTLATADRAAGAWLRATGYHESMAGSLDRSALDALAPRNPLRIQHQTGALWMLNSLALALVTHGELPACVECDAAGRPTGRIWRGDSWLQERLDDEPPALAPIGRELAALGITAIMDASVSTGTAAAALLADACRCGDLPQRLSLMSGGPLTAPADAVFAVGPVKIVLDEHDLPPFETVVAQIVQARRWQRKVAVHCVTAVELAMALAALEAAGGGPGDDPGACHGDRIEHGGIIPNDALPILRQLGLAVVSQPAFIHERGDRYLADVDPDEQNDLYRCGSLLAAGIPVAASSDAPYATWDCWTAMRAAVDRRTRNGQTVSLNERLEPEAALRLFLSTANDPGGQPPLIAPGADADFCLLDRPLEDALSVLDKRLVAATVIGGRIVHSEGYAGSISKSGEGSLIASHA